MSDDLDPILRDGGTDASSSGLLAACRATWFELDRDPDAAMATATDLVARAEREDDELSAAYALCSVVWWLGQFGDDVETAFQFLDRIEQTVVKTDDAALRLRWHDASAVVHGAIGDRAGRFDHLERMRAVAVDLGDVWHELVALHDMARHFGRDDLLEAAIERAEAVSARLSEPPSELVSLLMHSAGKLADAGRLDRAESRARRALSIAEEHHLRQWIGFARCTLAEVLASAGNGGEALEVLADAERAGALPPSDLLLSAARVHRSLGDTATAIARYGRLLELPHSGRTGAQHCVDAARELAPLLAAAGEWQRAYEVQVLFEELRTRFQSDDDARRLVGLEVMHRVALARQLVEQEQERSRGLAEDVARLEELQRELSELASHDPLTGVFNRRWVDTELAAVASGAPGGRACVAIFDADHFKAVNDRFGHAVGDEVLRSLARVVATQLRAGDVLARLGGEEFLLLLPATDVPGARAICEHVRLRVAAHDWSTIAPGLTLTISVGVARFDPVEGVEGALAAADAHLYAAKRSGRNVVRG